MSKIIKVIGNETIEIVEYSKANAFFQTNKYPNDELFCVMREQINPFDMYAENQRLQNIINKIDKLFEVDTHCGDIYYAIGVVLNKKYYDIEMINNEEIINILGSDK